MPIIIEQALGDESSDNLDTVVVAVDINANSTVLKRLAGTFPSSMSLVNLNSHPEVLRFVLPS